MMIDSQQPSTARFTNLPLTRNNSTFQQSENYRNSTEPQLITLNNFPAGAITGIGGLVCARSVKLLESDDVETRRTWWDELRDEVRSHAKALGCRAVLGYTETTTINDELFVLSAIGTAANIDWRLLSGGGGGGGVNYNVITTNSNNAAAGGWLPFQREDYSPGGGLAEDYNSRLHNLKIIYPTINWFLPIGSYFHRPSAVADAPSNDSYFPVMVTKETAAGKPRMNTAKTTPAPAINSCEFHNFYRNQNRVNIYCKHVNVFTFHTIAVTLHSPWHL
jgi:hypothetical protein